MRDLETCSLCPRLCRHACPVAVGTGREAATPTALAGVLVDHARGAVSDNLARQASTLCVDCGACQDECHLHQPLPSILREARAALLSPSATPPLPEPPSGVSSLFLVVHRDDAELPGCEVPSDAELVVCPQRLGVDADFGLLRPNEAVATTFSGYTLYTMDGGIFEVLRRAGLDPQWAVKAPEGATGSCVCALGDRPPLACCGARGPLREHHPGSAKQLAAAFARRLAPGTTVLDTRCAQHLRSSGCAVDSRGITLEGDKA